MNSELWRSLPSELLERSLSFLPVPVLSGFRTVCRRWNALICDPGFVQRAPQEYVVARYAIRESEPGVNDEESGFEPFGADHGYTFLDVHSKRWYAIPHDEPALFDRYIAGSVAMDGGLVCHVLESQDTISILLSNPVAATSRILPPAPHYSTGGVHLKVDMVVTNRTCTVFLMPGVDALEGPPPPMVVYDTGTNQWRTAPDLPLLPSATESCVACSVVFGDSLFALMIPNVTVDVTEHWLWRYDHVWSYTGVSIRGCVLVNPKLMVSAHSRLLLAAWTRRSSGKFLYEVSEVVLERWVVETVVSVDVERVFGVVHQEFGLGSMHAVSCGESVVLLWKPSGVARIYDLRTCCWYDSLPENPVVAMEGFMGFQLWYGKGMQLHLPCNTLWIHHESDDASRCAS